MKNGKYLDSLSSDKKSKILKNIASHYRISVAEAEDEVRDDDAEMLYEYIANDKSLRMEVYNDMERGKMAKGGGISKSTKYVPNRDVKSLMVVLQGELKSLKGTDIVDGVYLKTGRSSATKNSTNNVNAILEKLKKIQKNNEYDADLGLDKNDIQELIDAGFDGNDIEIIYGGYKAPVVNADTEFGDTTSGLVASDSGYQKRLAKRIAESGKKGMFEIGLKYPSFDWKQIVEHYKINVKPKIKIVNRGSYQYKYEIYLGNGVAIGHSIAYKREDKNDWEEDGGSVGVLNFNKPTAFQKSRNHKSGFNGGYWGIVIKNKKDVYYIIDTLLKQKSGYVKDVELFANGLGGISVSDVNDLQFAKGGNVNPLEKELHKLQKELNSSRLSTYRQGDNSTEEQNRQKERAAKLVRFNQVLAMLREDEITGEREGERKAGMDNYAKGGKTASSKPKMVRTQFEEEEFEYGNGGLLSGFNYSIGGL